MRLYAPRIGRFLQTDPIGYAGGLNLYGYTGADPVNLQDPSGLDPGLTISISPPRYLTDDSPGPPTPPP